MLVREGCHRLVQAAPYWLLALVCLNVFAFQFPGAKEPRSPGVTPWVGLECMQYFFQIGLPEVWHFVWMYLFQHFFIVCRSQCEFPNILMFLFSMFAPILPDFIQNVSFYCFSSVEACLPGNTVLKLLKLFVNRACAKSAKMCHFQ